MLLLEQRTPKSFPDVLGSENFSSDCFRRYLPIALGEFNTPLIVLDQSALKNNLQVMAQWCTQYQMEIMPHGKTSMSPELWYRQIEAGATGITAATGWQALEMLYHGIPVVQIANECTDPKLLSRINQWLVNHPTQYLACWVDSHEGVRILESVIDPNLVGQFGVLVELGSVGARGGVRECKEAERIATSIANSRTLTLKGVAGYEGSIAHDRSEQSILKITAYMKRLVRFLQSIRQKIIGTPWITAGGSAYFDVVTKELQRVDHARRILRSGAYLIHDDALYKNISPCDQSRSVLGNAHGMLRPAMRAYARVISQPEYGLALLDAGKRDFPYDEGLPIPLATFRQFGEPEVALDSNVIVSAMNDQHTYLTWNPELYPYDIRVGDIVRLGLSHPCTACDKWRMLPVADVSNNEIIDVVETIF